MVEQVEGLKAELDSGLLAEVLAGVEGQNTVFVEGEMNNIECRARALADSTVIVSTQIETFPGESSRIDKRGSAMPVDVARLAFHSQRSARGHVPIAHTPGVANGINTTSDGLRRSGEQIDDCACLPVAQDAPEEFILTIESRHVVNHVGAEDVPAVEIGQATACPRVVRIRYTGGGIDIVQRGVSNVPGVGIAGLEHRIAGEFGGKHGLQGVVDRISPMIPDDQSPCSGQGLERERIRGAAREPALV